jgi:hypothetical protein
VYTKFEVNKAFVRHPPPFGNTKKTFAVAQLQIPIEQAVQKATSILHA